MRRPRLWHEPVLLEAARLLLLHRRRPHLRRPRCAAGCGAWPCPTFRAALDRVLSRAWQRQLCAAGSRLAGR